MKRLNFKKIDAFTDGLSSGNPAGYILLGPHDSLSVAEMLRVAGELKGFVNEVGFVRREGKRVHLRFYSSEREVAFCGHATIAILYDLITNDPELLDEPELSIRVLAGEMPVANRVRAEGAVYITAPEPLFLSRDIPLAETAEVLGISVTAIDSLRSMEVVDGGLRTFLVPLISLEECLALSPDQEELRQFSERHDFDILHVATSQTVQASNRYRVRVFAPKYGYLEDPATGSGNSAFGYSLIRHGHWETDFAIEQGPSRSHPNIVKLRRLNIGGIERIQFGGPATTRIVGHYCLQDRE
jgi:PhzF family phenazine biosynthesis protein